MLRLHVEGHIKQKYAARRLGISTRQVRNPVRGYRKHGAAGLIHGNRGRESNHETRERDPAISLEEATTGISNAPASAAHGELIRIDGSPHDVFNGHAASCALIVFIDDAHRPVLHSTREPELILSIHSRRKLSKNLTLQHNNNLCQIKVSGIGYALRGATVTACEDFTGKLTILHNGRALAWKIYRAENHRCPSPPVKQIQDMEAQTRSPLAKTHHQSTPKAEISIWVKTGNFYFGLTRLTHSSVSPFLLCV